MPNGIVVVVGVGVGVGIGVGVVVVVLLSAYIFVWKIYGRMEWYLRHDFHTIQI